MEKEQIGADLCGFASMDRFEGAPKQMDPRYIFPDAKTCIVLAFRIPRGYFRGIEEGTYFCNYTAMGYAENINLRKPIDFSNIPTVVGDDRDSLLEDIEDIEDITSPSTGDNTTAVCVVAVTGLISALAVLLFKRKNNLNEVNK